MNIKGTIKARVIGVRFASSGKIALVKKFSGDRVKKWDLVASLDRKILQTSLDKELSDFEKVRADFEVYAGKNPNPQSDMDKYLKKEKQAVLDASVKQVELSKAYLDQCDLFSPCDGVILDDNGIIPGIYVTPAGSEVKIVDSSSFYFEGEVGQKDIKNFKEPKKAEIKIEGLDPSEVEGQTSSVYSDGKRFYVRISITRSSNLMYGLSAEARI